MKRRSTLFHVDGERGLRGGERQLLYLAAALRVRDRRNVIYCRPSGSLEHEARQQGFETRTISWEMLKDARHEGAILHAHTGRSAGWAIAARALRVPFVAHRRVDFPVNFVSAELKYARCGAVVAVSMAISSIMVAAGIPPEKISVIPDAVPSNPEESSWVKADANLFAPAGALERREARAILSREFDIDPAMTWIGNLAALVPHKDHRTLLAAAAIALKQLPQLRFIIAGTGTEEIPLQALRNQLGLGGKVYFLGHRPDPLSVLKSLDIYVQSSWGEGMGSVLLEAATCGVPIVATSAGGIPDVLIHDLNGLLVPPRNPETLARALVELLGDPARQRRIVAEGLKAVARFGLKRMAVEMENIYDRLP